MAALSLAFKTDKICSSPCSWHALLPMHGGNIGCCYLYSQGIPVMFFGSKFIFMQLIIFFSRENRDKIEIYLTFGATRVEACRPILIEALKLVLIPLITSMR